jgi:hypothetical protein
MLLLVEAALGVLEVAAEHIMAEEAVVLEDTVLLCLANQMAVVSRLNQHYQSTLELLLPSQLAVVVVIRCLVALPLRLVLIQGVAQVEMLAHTAILVVLDPAARQVVVVVVEQAEQGEMGIL